MVPKNLFQGWRPLNLDAVFKDPNLTGRDYMEIMARVAIDKYNQTKVSITFAHCKRWVIISLFFFFFCLSFDFTFFL